MKKAKPSPELSEAVIDELMFFLLEKHPKPWRYEFDWGHEVYANDGTRIACCMSQEVAKRMIEIANAKR